MAEPKKDNSHTIQYIVTLLALLALTITLAAMGYRDAMNTSIGAFIGYGMSSRPGATLPAPAVGAVTVGLAIGANIFGHLLGS